MVALLFGPTFGTVYGQRAPGDEVGGVEPAGGWEAGVGAGVVRVDGDFAVGAAEQWVPIGVARVGRRLNPLAALEGEVWRSGVIKRAESAAASDDLPGVWGVGVQLAVTPWAGREWPLDPALRFGVEKLWAGDDEDRSLAFVAGLGLERRLGGRFVAGGAVRHHFLTVDEPVEDGVQTGRDASLWEAQAQLTLRLGQTRGR